MSNVYLTTGRRHIHPCFVLLCKIDPMVQCLLKTFATSVKHQDIFSNADFIFDLLHTTYYILSKSVLYNVKHSGTKLMVKTQDMNSVLDLYTTWTTSNTPCLLVLYVNSCLKIHKQWFNNAQWGYERQRYAFYDWQNGLRHQFRRYLVRQGQALCFK